MQTKNTKLIVAIILGLLLVLFIGRKVFVASPVQNTNTTATKANDQQQEKARTDNSTHAYQHADIPQKVYDVLKYIRSENHAMDGYVGGRQFTNREKVVPQQDDNGNTITYEEWDVNPKIRGQNRGTERILTGSDGRAWYTNDHYQTFKEIK